MYYRLGTKESTSAKRWNEPELYFEFTTNRNRFQMTELSLSAQCT